MVKVTSESVVCERVRQINGYRCKIWLCVSEVGKKYLHRQHEPIDRDLKHDGD